MPAISSLEAFFADLQLVASISQDVSLVNRVDRGNALGNSDLSHLPSEITHAIVLHLVDDTSLTHKRTLSPCVLTYRYWAALLRATFFRRLTLGSQEDIDALLALVSTPSFARPPFANCLHTIILDIRLPTAQRPWWHHVSKLRGLQSVVAIHLAFRQAGPSWYDGDPAHAMFAGLPRTVPTRALGLTVLLFDSLRFASTNDVSNLLGQLPTVRMCTCRDVVFDDAPSASRARRGLVQESLVVLASQCTVVGRSSDYISVAANPAVTSALLGAARCPPGDANIWSRILCLATIQFTEYKYDVCMVYLEPEGKTLQDSFDHSMVLEVAFGRPLPNAAALVVSCKMSISDAVPTSRTKLLNWYTYAKTVLGLEHIMLDAHRTTFIESDVLQRARACTSGVVATASMQVGKRGPRIGTRSAQHGGSTVFLPRKRRGIAYRLIIELTNFHATPTSDQHSPADVDPRVPLPRLVVPQRVYSAPGRCTYLPTIRFYNNDRPGVLLSRALENELGDLVDAARQVRLSVQASRITVRINWPGYPPWPTVTNVLHHSFEACPMTMAQLAHRVAKITAIFWGDMIVKPCEESGWVLGEVEFDQLVLLELRHMSTGSWQPVFCRVQ
ncbi:hypothetical protein PsYK624_117270 [Phanerochaete sordida]|uniref:Uncharacterized protein n=1 Tax=Phanerochaete sordida TaxID=48140 RepID=A0A9P3GIF7_9APHY|nr:hypothetical protein PsYK624_117270 [Phanerochaete sordida]